MTNVNPNPTVDMESNNSTTTPAAAKKFWRMVQAVYIMLRKGISKGKLMMDLKLMMIKRNNKLSGKVHRWSSAITSAVHRRTHDQQYPDFHLPPFYLKKCRNNNNNNSCHEIEDAAVQEVLTKLEESMPASESAPASPVLPGFGKTPMVRQLRITDSPFPLSDVINEEESHIDEAAEEFITKFYKDLRRRNAMASDS